MRAILIIMLILSPLVGMSQTVLFTGSPSMLTYHKGALGADSILKIPFADTTGVGSLWPDSLRKGAIMVNSADTMLYYHDGNGWRVVGSADTGFIRDQFAHTQEANFRIGGIGAAGKLVAGNMIKSNFGDSSLIVGWYPASPSIIVMDSFNSAEHPLYPIRTGFIMVNDIDRDGVQVDIHMDDLVSIGAYGDTASGSMNVGVIQSPYQLLAGYTTIGETFHLTSLPNVAYDANLSVVNDFLNFDSVISQYGFLSLVDSNVRLSTPVPRDRVKKYGFASTGGAPNYFSGKTFFSRKAINDLSDPNTGQRFPSHGPHMDSFAQNFAVKILGNLMYKPGTEGDGKILTSSADGTVNIVDAGSIIPDGAFVQDGNAFGETAVLGTTDNEALELIADGNTALRVNPDAKVQYLDGTEGDGKILMSSSDGTLSAQSRDSVMNGVWRSGIVNNMGAHATLRTSADTITIARGSEDPVMQAVGNRMAFNDIVRNNLEGTTFIGYAPSTGNFGTPISFNARIPSGGGGNRFGSLFRTDATNVTSIRNITVGRSRAAGPIYIGIGDENWAAATATTNYFLHSGSFQPSSTNWFIFGEQNVKSQLAGNLLLGATSDNGHKLQVSGSIYGRNQSEPFNQFIMAESFTPTGTADASGEVGSMAWDDDYIYIKTSDGWKRSALSTF